MARSDSPLDLLRSTAALFVRRFYPDATGHRAPTWAPPHALGQYDAALIVRGTGGAPDTEDILVRGPLRPTRKEARRALAERILQAYAENWIPECPVLGGENCTRCGSRCADTP